MAPTIDFWVNHGKRHLPSAEALGAFADLAPEVTHPWDLQGGLVIEDEDLTLRWSDTLVPLIRAVCLDPIPGLARTGHATATPSDEYGYLRLDAEGTWIRLGGDDLPSGRVERDPLLHGMLACVGRFVELLRGLGQDGFDVKALREDRTDAIRALSEATWSTEGPEQLPPIGSAGPRLEGDGPVMILRGETAGWVCDGHRLTLPGAPEAWNARLRAEVVPCLERNESVVVRFPEGYGYARFDVEGDRVRVSGDGLADLRMPRAGLLASLGDAG
ncbi:MAG: hypothetical protein R3F61_14505 [Myxococcota bacterium]